MKKNVLTSILLLGICQRQMGVMKITKEIFSNFIKSPINSVQCVEGGVLFLISLVPCIFVPFVYSLIKKFNLISDTSSSI